MSETQKTEKSRLGNGAIVALCCSFVIGMVGMAYAAVPLYEMFCKVTGYGGTTQRVEQASGVVVRCGNRGEPRAAGAAELLK